MAERYVAPTCKADAFHCPHCGVYAHQTWHNVFIEDTYYQVGYQPSLSASYCTRCYYYTIWLNERIVFPFTSTAPLPSDDMPETVKADFEEARTVFDQSPRAAAALLRLSLERLLRVELGLSGRDLNDTIGNLVAEGLDEETQQAMDCVRVYGNEAVHPGQIDLSDDKESALILFDLVNLIVDEMITKPKKRKELYNKIPDSKKRVLKAPTS